jgi:hypothetical protein
VRNDDLNDIHYNPATSTFCWQFTPFWKVLIRKTGFCVSNQPGYIHTISIKRWQLSTIWDTCISKPLHVKLIRYQFWCTRCALRLMKSLQWCSGRKSWKSDKISEICKSREKKQCHEIEPDTSKDRDKIEVYQFIILSMFTSLTFFQYFVSLLVLQSLCCYK